MAGNALLGNSVPQQMSGLPTTAPHTPHTDLDAPSISPIHTETRREKRRREWQENKIRKSREKKQYNQATPLAEQIGLQVPGHAVHRSDCAPEHEHTRSAAGRRRHPLHGRSESQWLVIEELKLCAGCLSRTTPPHKPGDGHAPCTGQPNATFEDAKISAIRKALDRLRAAHRRDDGLEQTCNKSPQRGRQWRPGDTSSDGSQYTLCQGNEPRHRHADVYVSDTFDPQYEAHAIPSDNPHPFAPLYNLSNSSSCPQPGVRGTAPSQCLASHAEDLYGSFSSVHLNIGGLIENVLPRTAKPDDHSSELLAGMAPPTPLISGLPGLLIEEELVSIGEHMHPSAVIPDCESSSVVPRVEVEDWEVKTKVCESPQESLACSNELAWKLLQPYDRTWTMQGLCPSQGGFDWDGSTKTLVDEPRQVHTKPFTIVGVGKLLQDSLRVGDVARRSTY